MYKKNNRNSDDPKPLDFDEDEQKGPSGGEPFMTPEDDRGDSEDDQYYEEEEALSPEEVKKRKEEGTL